MFDGPSQEWNSATPELSVVAPLFNEEESVLELYRRLSRGLVALGMSYELVLVDDGSRDATPQLIDDLQRDDGHVVCLHLSRNFGHQAAVSAGLDHARGLAVLVMDGDLQDPPELIPQLLRRWREGYDVVYAVRTKRKEGICKRAGYFLFYRLLRAVSNLDIPLDSGDFCLMDRRVVDALRALPERSRFVRGLRAFVGFRQTAVTYERAARQAGQSKYTFRALVRLALDGLLDFSTLPLSLIGRLAIIALAGTLAVVAAFLLGGRLSDVHALLLLLGLLGAFQLVSLAVVAAYVQRMFVEIKGRPTYILKDVHGRIPPRRGKRFKAKRKQPHSGSDLRT